MNHRLASLALVALLAACGGTCDDEPESGPTYAPDCPASSPACVVQPPAPAASTP